MAELSPASSVPQAELSARRAVADDLGLSAAVSTTHAAVARFLELRSTPHAQASQQDDERLSVEQNAVRVAVARLVGILRARGDGPERVLISLKEVLASMPRCDADVADELRQQVIRWAIDDYYVVR